MNTTSKCACGRGKWPSRNQCGPCWQAMDATQQAAAKELEYEHRMSNPSEVGLPPSPKPGNGVVAQVLHQISLNEAQMDRLYLGSNIVQKRAAIQALLKWDREENV